MRQFIYDQADWPTFYWDNTVISPRLAEVRFRQGRLLGQMASLGFRPQAEAEFQTITQDVLKTSEIENERLDVNQVRSSVARHLGIDIGGAHPVDRHVDGVVEMLLDAAHQYQVPLTAERLFQWHRWLFPIEKHSLYRLQIGDWRDGPMQVVSGYLGQEQVHFQAPDADRVGAEMDRFLNWLLRPTGATIDPVIQAGIAHLWFVTIHPFDDGNGRIARAIADLVLARAEAQPQRFYSLSAQIQRERSAYYDILQETQSGTLDITHWLHWFLDCLDAAIALAETELATVLTRTRFWEQIGQIPINDRQRLMLNKLLHGFDGNLTSSKWAKIAKCSQDTATRDINDLVAWGVLVKGPAGGRSTTYNLSELQTGVRC